MRRVSPPAVSRITTSEAMVGVKQIKRTDRQRALFWLPVCVCVNPAERETPFQPASIFYLFPFLNFTSLPSINFSTFTFPYFFLSLPPSLLFFLHSFFPLQTSHSFFPPQTKIQSQWPQPQESTFRNQHPQLPPTMTHGTSTPSPPSPSKTVSNSSSP